MPSWKNKVTHGPEEVLAIVLKDAKRKPTKGKMNSILH